MGWVGAVYSGASGAVGLLSLGVVTFEKLNRSLGGIPIWPIFQGDCQREEFQASPLCSPTFLIPEYVVLVVAGIQFTVTVVKALKSTPQKTE